MTAIGVALLILRVTLGGVLLASGGQKIVPRMGFGGVRGTAASFADAGIRGGRGPVVLAAVAQMMGGASVLVGFGTQFGALICLSVMTVAVAVSARRGIAAQRGGAEYPMVLAMICVVLAISGPGAFSLDNSGHLTHLPLHFTLAGVVASIAAGAVSAAMLHVPIKLVRRSVRKSLTERDRL
jgi:putative oxidoreductase